MNTALAQIKQFAATANDTDLSDLITSLRRLTHSLESPNDTIHRYGHMSLQTSAIKTGFNLGLFKLLSEADGPMTSQNVARRVDADPQLIHRLLRYLTAIDAIGEVSTAQFEANQVTKNLNERVVTAGLNHYFYTAGPQYEALPNFLKRTKYQNPVDEQNTAFQEAWKTQLHAFQWFGENPEHLAHFNEYMALRRQPKLTWLSVYPVREQINGRDARDGTRALYVNIGGGIGHQCRQFKEQYPDLQGKVILQDLPHSIEKALPTLGVENMEHDFFQPQPIKGKFLDIDAPTYILKRTKAANAPCSLLPLQQTPNFTSCVAFFMTTHPRRFARYWS